MKLYTKTDLERAARIAALRFKFRGGDPEEHIQEAVLAITQEAPDYYDEHFIREHLGEEALRKLYLVSLDNRATSD